MIIYSCAGLYEQILRRLSGFFSHAHHSAVEYPINPAAASAWLYNGGSYYADLYSSVKSIYFPEIAVDVFEYIEIYYSVE